MTTKRCVSWIAVSSKPQAERASPDAQADANQRFVDAMPEHYGVEGAIAETLRVTGSRSIIELSEAERIYPKAYGILARMIRNSEFDILLCYRDDRLGREAALIMTIRALCRSAGILVVETSGAMPASLDAAESEGENYVVAFKAVRSRNEILTLVDRRRTGMYKRVSEGKLFPGRTPFGYRYDYDRDGNRQIAIDEDAASTVRRILLDLYLGYGHGAPAICDILNDEGIPAAEGMEWAIGSVQAIIERAERYAGILEWNKRPRVSGNQEYMSVDAHYPAILAEDEYRQVEAQREARRHTNHRNRALSGICICGYCGKTMSYQQRKLASGIALVLMCRNRDCKHKHGRTYESEIIAMIRQLIIDLVSYDDETIRALILQGYDDDDAMSVTIAQEESEMDRLLADRRRLERARERANHAYIDLGSIGEIEYLNRLRKIEDKTAEIDERLADAEERIESRQAEVDREDRLRDAMEKGLAMMDTVEDEPENVNQSLRGFIRVHIRRKEKQEERFVFEII